MADASGRPETSATFPDGKCDVFLVHSSADSTQAQIITEALDSKGLKTYAHYRDAQEFDIGKSTYDCILEAVEVADCVLILLTKNAIQSHWVTLEILLSLEKAQRLNKMCVRMVLDKTLTKEEAKKMQSVDYIPSIVLDYNKENWQDMLVQKLKEEVTMTDVLPAGNVAHGLVFNYFCGFLRHILPDLKGKVKSCELYQKNPGRMSGVFYILLPESCQCQTMEGEFNDGEYVVRRETFVPIESGHGDKKRRYNPTVYSITKRGDQTYYFLAECPTIMETIGKLASSSFVEKFDKKTQLARFRQTLSDLVDHKSNERFNNTVEFFVYNDEESSHAEKLWSMVCADARKLSDTEPGKGFNLKQKYGRKEGEQDIVASITYSDDHAADRSTAMAVMDRLANEGITFSNGDGTDGQTDRSLGLSYLRNARWNVLILSKESVTDDKMLQAFDVSISESVNEDVVKVVPILSPDTGVADLPNKFRWATVLESSKPEYLQILMGMVQGPDIQMMEKVTAGKVYEGLAWSYILNYLPVTLGQTAEGKDVTQRFREARSKLCPGIKCVPKLFVIAPKSCSFPAPGSVAEGEVHLGELECISVGFRKYFLQFYKLTLDSGEEVCYAREYATPTVAMYEMVNHFPSSGLHRDHMYEQSEKFAKFVSRVINDDAFKQSVADLSRTCTLVHFDDEIESVAACLKTELSACLLSGEFLAPESPPS